MLKKVDSRYMLASVTIRVDMMTVFIGDCKIHEQCHVNCFGARRLLTFFQSVRLSVILSFNVPSII